MASIIRNSFSRNARALVARRNVALVNRPAVTHFIRFNSSQTPSEEQHKRKELLERQDDLQRDWDAKILSYEELLPITEAPTPDTYVIDVREPDEVVQGMIPSAVNLPLSVLADSLHLSPVAFLEKHGYEKPRKDQRVVFYCRSGMRSSTASDVAKRNGYKHILNYKGSWLEWTQKQNVNTRSA